MQIAHLTKYDNRCLWVKNNWKALLLIGVASCSLTSVILFMQGIHLLPCLGGWIFSLSTFLIGYAMGSIVLGVQAKNPAFSIEEKGLFSLFSFCHASFYFFGITSLVFSFLLPILAIGSSAPEELIINGTLAGFGITYVAAKIHCNYYLQENDVL